jgi:hypothetical protein
LIVRDHRPVRSSRLSKMRCRTVIFLAKIEFDY